MSYSFNPDDLFRRGFLCLEASFVYLNFYISVFLNKQTFWMEIKTDWLFIMITFVSLLGAVISIVLYVVNRNYSFSPKVLAAIIFSVSYTLFGFGLAISNEYLNYPHLYRTPVFLSICISPLAYIYVRSVLEQQFKFKKWDFLLFVPPLLITLHFLPFYVLTSNEKIKIITPQLANKSNIAREPEGLLPEGLGILLRLFYNLCVLVATYLLLLREKKLKQLARQIEQNNEIFQWLFFLVTVLSVSFIVLIFELLFSISRFFDLYRLTAMTVLGTLVLICFYLLIKPNILYGLKGWLQESEHEIANETILDGEKPLSESKKITLTREQGLLYRQAIEKHFQDTKPYLKPGYTIRDLSNELNIPTYLLSSFINQEYSKNFNEFVNDERVDYLEAVIKKSSDHFQFTLEALGQKAGFKSRTAFISAVKKKTGKTPSELFGRGG